MEETCQGNHAKSISILNSMGYNEDEIGEMIDWFIENGGHCDCEVNLNVIRRRVLPTVSMSTTE